MILQEILFLISGFKRVQQKDFYTGRICTTMSSLFPCCKTKTVIWQIRRNKRTIIYCLLRKKCITKKEHILFYETFFRYEWETDVNNMMKKNYNTVSLKKIVSQDNYCFH